MWSLRLEFRCKIRVHTRGLVPEASPCDQSPSVCLALCDGLIITPTDISLIAGITTQLAKYPRMLNHRIRCIYFSVKLIFWMKALRDDSSNGCQFKWGLGPIYLPFCNAI